MPDENRDMAALCLGCGTPLNTAGRCARCGSGRHVRHPELFELSIAHLDCDAFFAAIEKRDRPELRNRPVIVGGGRRGVVMTACYVARIKGVHSAMPMFRARELCPEAAVIPPEMAKYRRVGRAVRRLMREVTPLVEALSVDEAFLDLGGTERLHGAPPAAVLARLVARIEAEIGVTASVGLSYNKFLAKIASDLEKPRGFSVIGRAEAADFLADKPVTMIWGVGRQFAKRLAQDGIRRIGDLRACPPEELLARYGAIGGRLAGLCRGIDSRPVNPGEKPVSISSETTFDEDIVAREELARRLWPLCESVARSLRRKGLRGRTITLKAKTARHRTLTRSTTIATPTSFAHAIFERGEALLDELPEATYFRLIGIGVSGLSEEGAAGQAALPDPAEAKRDEAERAMERLRERFGTGAIRKGRAL